MLVVLKLDSKSYRNLLTDKWLSPIAGIEPMPKGFCYLDDPKPNDAQSILKNEDHLHPNGAYHCQSNTEMHLFQWQQAVSVQIFHPLQRLLLVFLPPLPWIYSQINL